MLMTIIKFCSRYLYLPQTPTYDETAAEIFCRTVWSAQFAFNMGYISVFTCVLLTIERWMAVVKPKTYTALKTKHAVVAVIFVWIWGVAVNVRPLFRVKYFPDKHICKWTPLRFAKRELPWIDLTVQSIIPYTTMIVLYAHIYFRMKNLPRVSSNRHSQLKKVTIVALCACSALIIGWLPGRITFLLSKFGYVHPNSVLHTSFVIMAFCNSCVNPCLYAMCSTKFRQEYKAVFNKVSTLCCTSITVSHSAVAPDPAVVILPLPGHSGNSNMPLEIHEQSTL